MEKLQLIILKEMDKYLTNLLIRTNKAYNKYKNNPTYYNAKHIYHSNILIYNYLNELIKNDSEIPLNETIDYIFHLEDWFLLFENEEKKVTDFEQTFIFNSFNDSIPYPNFFKI